MKTLIAAIVVAAAAIVPASAGEVAHGPNGGPVIDAGPYHAELVRQDKALTIYVSTHESGAPVDTAGTTGFAIVQSGGKTERLTLTPEAPNKLVATATALAENDTKIAITFTIAGQPPVSGRFDLSAAHDGHTH